MKGFTLVEMVIVIAIVIVLSVVSVPIYRNYVDKAKMTEGYALLGAILSAQKAYYSEYGNFLQHNNWTCNLIGLGVDARSNKFFTYFCANGGGSYDKVKYAFFSGCVIPKEFRNKESALCLNYNLTTGVTYYEGWV